MLIFYKPNIPMAVIEAKDNKHTIKSGITLDAPFAFSSNGDKFYCHDRTITSGPIESKLALDAFPTYD